MSKKQNNDSYHSSQDSDFSSPSQSESSEEISLVEENESEVQTYSDITDVNSVGSSVENFVQKETKQVKSTKKTTKKITKKKFSPTLRSDSEDSRDSNETYSEDSFCQKAPKQKKISKKAKVPSKKQPKIERSKVKQVPKKSYQAVKSESETSEVIEEMEKLHQFVFNENMDQVFKSELKEELQTKMDQFEVKQDIQTQDLKVKANKKNLQQIKVNQNTKKQGLNVKNNKKRGLQDSKGISLQSVISQNPIYENPDLKNQINSIHISEHQQEQFQKYFQEMQKTMQPMQTDISNIKDFPKIANQAKVGNVQTSPNIVNKAQVNYTQTSPNIGNQTQVNYAQTSPNYQNQAQVNQIQALPQIMNQAQGDQVNMIKQNKQMLLLQLQQFEEKINNSQQMMIYSQIKILEDKLSIIKNSRVEQERKPEDYSQCCICKSYKVKELQRCSFQTKCNHFLCFQCGHSQIKHPQSRKGKPVFWCAICLNLNFLDEVVVL